MSYYNQGNAGQQQNNTGFYGGGGQPQQQTNLYGGQGGYADPNAWQQQQQQTTTQQQPYQPQQQQQQQQGPSVWNPMAAMNPASLASVATMAASIGSSGKNSEQMIESFLQDSWARMIPGLTQFMLALRPYFAVDNAYVVRKMKRVLVPYIYKSWKRQEKEVAPSSNGGIPPVAYQSPIHDECAPDLYLPLMSSVTYVLLSALLYGTAGKFNPEVIPKILTQCLVTQSLEVVAIRFGFYLMQCPIAILDLFSYTGYKYLGLCVNMFVGIVVGHFGLGMRGYYATFLLTASAAAFFMFRTIFNNIPPHTSHNGPKREVVVAVFALSQFATMWFVSQTKFL